MSGNPTVIDGGYVSVPAFAFYKNDGMRQEVFVNAAENHRRIAQMLTEGDPQLDATIDHVLHEIKQIPKSRPNARRIRIGRRSVFRMTIGNRLLPTDSA